MLASRLGWINFRRVPVQDWPTLLAVWERTINPAAFAAVGAGVLALATTSIRVFPFPAVGAQD